MSAGADETTTYAYDANDRLQTESTSIAPPFQGGEGGVKFTIYGYNHTQQTSKEVFSDPSLAQSTQLSAVSFAYDWRGRLVEVETTTFTSGVASHRETVTYGYDSAGMRVSAIVAVDETADGTIDTIRETKFLVDSQNATGYQQTLRETTTDGAGNLVKTIDYVFGLDEISQTVVTYDAQGDIDTVRTDVFGHDGHDNVRVLLDAVAAVLTLNAVPQLFHYDAYGNLLNMPASAAGTALLANGDEFDARINLAYRDARWLSQTTGRFLSLDPFFGRNADPLSFNKYLYAHADAVNGIDPTGTMNLTVALARINIAFAIGAMNAITLATVHPDLFYFGFVKQLRISKICTATSTTSPMQLYTL